jgi:hypothetical protein
MKFIAETSLFLLVFIGYMFLWYHDGMTDNLMGSVIVASLLGCAAALIKWGLFPGRSKLNSR